MEIKLTEEQVKILGWFETGLVAGETAKKLLVRARAGSGKTFLIEKGLEVAPELKMLYCTFAKRNQKEAELKIKNPRVEIKTLNALGFKFVRNIWPKSRPDDEVEKDRIVSVIGFQEKFEVKNAIFRLVGFAKNMLLDSAEDIADLAISRGIEADKSGWNTNRLADATIKVLEASKIQDKQNRISFNDQVWLPIVMGWASPCYDFVVVDEAQDMNLPQLLMAIAACNPDGRICIVGDDRQAIYGFRGAVSDGLDMMKQKLSAMELGLTYTMRCCHAVARKASSIVPDYKAIESATEGTIDEATRDNMLALCKPGDAILSRLNAPLMPLALSFIRNGVPAKIEGRDISKALKALVWKMKATSVTGFLTALDAWGQKQIAKVIQTKDGDRRAADIQDQVATLSAVAEGCESISEIETRLDSIFTDTEGKTSSTVLLSSTHKAKGLEWNRVFVLSDTFNRRFKNSTPNSEKEEQNLLYVAWTRAKIHLTMVN